MNLFNVFKKNKRLIKLYGNMSKAGSTYRYVVVCPSGKEQVAMDSFENEVGCKIQDYLFDTEEKNTSIVQSRTKKYVYVYL